MSCTQTSPCPQPDDCNPCNSTNPCYEDCGCLYPSTFDCVENFKKNYPVTGLQVGQDLYDLMDKLETILGTMQSQIAALNGNVFPTTTTSTTTSTTTTTTTVAPITNSAFNIINSTSIISDLTIDSISPSFYFNTTGDPFPLDNTDALTAKHGGFTSGFTVTISGTDTGIISLYKDSVLVEALFVNGGGTYTFASVTFTNAQQLDIELVDGVATTTTTGA